MALLAWLMLAVAPFVASARMVPAQQQASTMQAHTSHATMAMDAADCCDNHASHPDRQASPACHCALPCAGVLPSTLAGLASLPLAPAGYAPPLSIEAPLSGFAPPLRPPLA